MRASRLAADDRFGVFDDINRFADGRPQLLLFLNNEYHHEGVHELLLKASSDFPTWYINAGRAWLHRFVLNITFYHEYGPPIVLPADLTGSCVVWFDRPDLPALTTRFDRLAQLVSDPAYEVRSWPIHLANGAQPPVVQVWVHAARCRRERPGTK